MDDNLQSFRHHFSTKYFTAMGTVQSRDTLSANAIFSEVSLYFPMAP